MPSGLFTRRQHLQAVITNSWAGRPSSVDYLVVAGGGGGGSQSNANSFGGGGGAGGLLQGSILITAGTSYTITVGSGGTASANSVGTVGGNSVFGPITANGGGYGGRFGDVGAGGSGGGNGNYPITVSTISGGQGIYGQGNKGGDSTTTQTTTDAAGGGGGAGTVGLNGGSGIGGIGGAGVASDISGTRVTYTGGGGGSGYSTQGSGGVGGGGAAAKDGVATSGSANTGGGGGGGGRVSSNGTGGTGGSGIVIISYPGTTQWFTGGTVGYSDGKVIHVFTTSGTLTPISGTPVVGGYQIPRSLRFNSTDSAYLSRTYGATGDRKKFTYSCWVKRASIATGADQILFRAVDGVANFNFAFTSNNTLFVESGPTNLFTSTPVYRDTSAWYHIVMVFDSDNATAANRIIIYVNNVSQTQASGSVTSGTQVAINTQNLHYIGASPSDRFLSGYMAEVYFIDGQALTPSSFGETSNFTGVWVPKAYTGTYGTNGFYVNFSDNSNTTAATLGKDYSGNGNNWTPNNFSVTAGAGNDSLVDSPTAYGFDTGAGGTVRGNYATLNPLDAGSNLTFAEGNLQVSSTTNPNNNCRGTLGVATGKWYWEVTVTAGAGGAVLGIASASASMTTNFSGDLYGYDSNGNKQIGATGSAYGATYGTNDVIGIAFDADNLTITFYKNNTSQGAITGVTSGLTWRPFVHVNSRTVVGNFGQRPFAYTAPSGYKALCTQNLPTPTIGATSTTLADKYFNSVLWTGDGADNRSIIGVGFQPDFVWVKARNAAEWNNVYDVVRGANKAIYTNSVLAEETLTETFQSFDVDGFTVSYNSAYLSVFTNKSSSTYVAWNWKANGSGSTNTAGSITSTVSANTTSGFSVVTYTGTGSAATVGHGLGAAPSMIISKARGESGSNGNWLVYHSSLGATKYLILNATDAEATNSGAWNNTAPTSSVWSIGTFTGSNSTVSPGNIAYCFAAIHGFSAFGSYTGNGSTDGPFVYCGFRPRWLMIKNSSANSITAYGSWKIIDTSRYVYNGGNPAALYANASYAEGNRGNGSSDTFTERLDLLSNGFKLGAASSYDIETNESGVTYIYAAFAETPFKYSRAR